MLLSWIQKKNIVLGTKLLAVRAQLLFLINCSGIVWNLYLKFEILAFLLQISQYLAMLTQKCNKSCLSYLIFKHIETNSFILKAVSLDWILITVAVLFFSLQFWYKRLLSYIILFRIISYQFLFSLDNHCMKRICLLNVLDFFLANCDL